MESDRCNTAVQVILTYGMSSTTHRFLKEAHKRRHFQVVVAEAAPRYDGQAMARQLAEAGVQTTLIADSAVFAMMARANKVSYHRLVVQPSIVVVCSDCRLAYVHYLSRTMFSVPGHMCSCTITAEVFRVSAPLLVQLSLSMHVQQLASTTRSQPPPELPHNNKNNNNTHIAACCQPASRTSKH